MVTALVTAPTERQSLIIIIYYEVCMCVCNRISARIRIQHIRMRALARVHVCGCMLILCFLVLLVTHELPPCFCFLFTVTSLGYSLLSGVTELR